MLTQTEKRFIQKAVNALDKPINNPNTETKKFNKEIETYVEDLINESVKHFLNKHIYKDPEKENRYFYSETQFSNFKQRYIDSGGDLNKICCKRITSFNNNLNYYEVYRVKSYFL